MQRRRIHKSNSGKYQSITTEMRQKVIELVVSYNMPIKEAAHCVGIHPQTAKNFFIIYKKEGRIGKKEKRNKKRLDETFHQVSILLDQEHLEKSKVQSPDWIISSFAHANEEFNLQLECNQDGNELSRIPVLRDSKSEQQVTSTEPTQKVTNELINIKKENIKQEFQEFFQPKELPNLNTQFQYHEFQNSSYAAQLIQNLNFRAYLNQLAPLQNNPLFFKFQQPSIPQVGFQRHSKFHN